MDGQMDEWDVGYGWIDGRVECWLWMDRGMSRMLVNDRQMDE